MTLPESVQELADVIGRDKALRLVGSLPPCGKRSWRRALYVPTPERLDPTSLLVRVLGMDDARKLAEEFGGINMQPSTCAEAAKELRNDAIRAQYAAGASTKLLACLFGISTRHVRYVVSRST